MKDRASRTKRRTPRYHRRPTARPLPTPRPILLAETRIGRLIAAAKLTDHEIATELLISRSAVSNKVAGRRAWRVQDITNLLSLLSKRLGRRITFEEAFGRGPKRGAAA